VTCANQPSLVPIGLVTADEGIRLVDVA